MAEIIQIDSARAERDRTIHERWERWVELDRRAKETQRFEDGIAAGKAMGEFYAMFMRQS